MKICQAGRPSWAGSAAAPRRGAWSPCGPAGAVTSARRLRPGTAVWSTRSANSGSSSTSCISNSYDEKAVTGVAVRGSCGQAEIWSAGSKHHVTALEDSSQRSDSYAGSNPPSSHDVKRTATLHPPRRPHPGAAVPRGRPSTHRCRLSGRHLGHFALTGLLLEQMLPVPGSRVVTVSSLAHRIQARINFDDLQGERSYSRVAAYGQSKLANLMFTYELQRGCPARAPPSRSPPTRAWPAPSCRATRPRSSRSATRG